MNVPRQQIKPNLHGRVPHLTPQCLTTTQQQNIIGPQTQEGLKQKTHPARPFFPIILRWSDPATSELIPNRHATALLLVPSAVQAHIHLTLVTYCMSETKRNKVISEH